MKEKVAGDCIRGLVINISLKQSYYSDRHNLVCCMSVGSSLWPTVAEWVHPNSDGAKVEHFLSHALTYQWDFYSNRRIFCFSLLYVIVNGISLGSGLLIGQNRLPENIPFPSGKM